jgi:hypothetical protein
MDIVARRSGGHNVVGRPQARAAWQPAATAPAAAVKIFRRNADQPAGAVTLIGTLAPGGEIEIDFNPLTDRNVLFGTVSLSPSNTPSAARPEDGVWATLLFDRGVAASPASDSIDDDVPAVTAAPTVTKSDTSDDWTVFVPLPDAKGYSVYAGELEVRKASDDTLLRTIPFGNEVTLYVPMYDFDCKARYRRRNRYRESGSDGWSAWSPYANAYGLSSSASGSGNPPESGLASFDADPNDVGNPNLKETLYAT